MNDDLGRRMKVYERLFECGEISVDMPLVIRVDGHNFTRLTKKAYGGSISHEFHRHMVHTAKALRSFFDADFAYTQSDEITLIVARKSEKQIEHPFGGRPMKIASLAASKATQAFNEVSGLSACFDGRAFGVPSKIEATNNIVWRVFDARRNSIRMMGRAYFSEAQMHGKSNDEVLDMLQDAGEEYDDLPLDLQFGTAIFEDGDAIFMRVFYEDMDFEDRHRMIWG